MDSLLTSRRDFLKTSAISAAGLAAASIPITAATSSSGGAWTDGMQLNPNIDNLRVACANDPRLGTADFGQVNAVIEDDMDKMAMALAKKATATEAWATIFRKPAAKTWANVKVAIKAPGSFATVAKICKELNKLGVVNSNICYFDSNTTLCMVWFAPPTGVTYSKSANTADDKLHGLTKTPVPYPSGSTSQWNCATDIANGTIDILITMMYNHSHSDTLGGASLCCKSLYGVFNAVDVGEPLHGYNGGANDGITGMLALQKSSAIIGGTPPRQQLVLLDCVKGENFQPNRLLMGTFAPAVDYLCIMKIRKDIMGLSPKPAVMAKYATEFGYTEAQYTAMNWVDALSYVPSNTVSQSQQQKHSRLQMSISNSAFQPSSVDFDLPASEHMLVSISIFDQKGRLVRELSQRWDHAGMALSWDGKSESGMRVPAGMYAVKVSNAGNIRTGSIRLIPR
jgi:flagellar hook assembly protein FlgD